MKAVYKRVATYQIGVDILGFPIFVQHEIYQDNPVRTKKGGNHKALRWITCIVTLLKQH